MTYLQNNNPDSLDAFQWGDIALSQTLMIDNVPHATGISIADWLGYLEPKKAISKLISRNEYIKNYSVVVSLTTTDGKNYQTRVYHPIGFLLIVMESAQPKAKAMKEAVAKFVFHYSEATRKRADMTTSQILAISKTIVSIASQLATTKNAMVYKVLEARLLHLSDLIGDMQPDLSLLTKKPDQLALEV